MLVQYAVSIKLGILGPKREEIILLDCLHE
jgi:hypothetical protein